MKSPFHGTGDGSTRRSARSTAKRSPRGSLRRPVKVPFFGPFSAKTSSERVFSGSRCYQSLYLKTFSGCAIVQGRLLGSSIPYLKMEKKRKNEKSTSKNAHFCQNGSKIAQNQKKYPRKSSTLRPTPLSAEWNRWRHSPPPLPSLPFAS